MIRNNRHRNFLIYFSRWSRKGYAVFAALGKNVVVSSVPLGICESALLKSARKGLIVNEAGAAENFPSEDFEVQKERSGFPFGRGKVCVDEKSLHGDRYGTMKGGILSVSIPLSIK